MRFIIFLFGILFLGLMFSILSLTSYVESRSDSIVIDLSNGVNKDLYEIYGYDSSLSIYDVRVNLTSYCDQPVNVTFVIASGKNYIVKNYTIKPYGEINNIYCDTMYTLMRVSNYSCTLKMNASYKIEHQPYLILALPAFILLIIATTLIFRMISSF